jgi:hypothetical protein
MLQLPGILMERLVLSLGQPAIVYLLHVQGVTAGPPVLPPPCPQPC